jgi:heptaprenyl diphosphate synthase
MVKSKKISYIAILSALASAVYFFESFIPLPIGLPGARWGFSNFPVLISAISGFGILNTVFIAIIKTFLGSIFSGKLFSPVFFMGLFGAISSAFLMSFLAKKIKNISVLSISEIGAFFSNCVQAVIAGFFILKSDAIIYYFPYMIFFGIITAFLNASIVKISKRSISLNEKF